MTPAFEGHVRHAKEYGAIEVEPSEILNGDGSLRILDSVRDRYVTASFKRGRPHIQALGVCGVFPLTPEILVDVRPRFPVENMTHMVNVCGYSPAVAEAVRPYPVSQQPSVWIADTLADALLDSIDVIRQRGLMKEYVRRTDSSSFVHGRIGVSETMRRFAARGVRHRASFSWWERSVDIPANRCLRAAVVKLHARYARISAPGRKKERRQYAKGERVRAARIAASMTALRHVGDDPHLASLLDGRVRGARQLPASRSYYRAALDLAVAILTDRGVDLDRPGGTLELPSLVVNTELLFERYIRAELSGRFEDIGVDVLDGNQAEGRAALYEKPTPEMLASIPEESTWVQTEASAQPDVLFRDARMAFPLVADVKYTTVSGVADRSAVEQVVLYAVRYGCGVALTIHPRPHGGEAGLRVSGRIGDVLILHYRFDLASADLRAEAERMVSSLRRVLSRRSSTA